GNIFFDGKEITQISSSEMKKFRRHMQIIFQDPYSSLNPRKRIKDILEEPIRVHRIEEARLISNRVDELLELV
ncbi:peptide ABC transporter substrate-binding protein, partial [Bifidobacterium thermophilum]|nr:peptide ABC transporter substrate-binding protein [Bifidobacterium thermophilum]